MKTKPEKVIETAAIRLTADETRAVLKAATGGDKPIQHYGCCNLVAIGLMKSTIIPKPDRSKEIADRWKTIGQAVKAKDLSAISNAISKIRDYGHNGRRETGYVLTPLGKQVARGVTVRLNGQFKGDQC